MEKVREWIKEQYQKTPILMLAVGMCTLIVAATGLGFTIAAYKLQIHAGEPMLVLAGPSIDLRSERKSVSLGFSNIGKNPARRGVSILFGVAKDGDWAHKQTSLSG